MEGASGPKTIQTEEQPLFLNYQQSGISDSDLMISIGNLLLLKYASVVDK